MSDCIEKLKELADQIEREHVAELQTLEKRYNTDLREAREARDIAIKEAAEYNHQLGDIIEYLGVASWEKPVLSSQDRYGRIMSELDKRLMPPGMEWPRFEDGVFVLPSDKGIIGIEYSKTGNIVIVTANDDEPRMVYAKGERVKRPVTEVLGADVLPIKVAKTMGGAE